MAQTHNINDIQESIRQRYAEVSRSASGKFQYPTGREGAEALGYDAGIINEMPPGLLDSFCGVGNPFKLGPVNPGEAVLDVGCGGGFDMVVASRLVGPEGKVRGIDVTPQMVEKALANLASAGVANGKVLLAGAEDIPYDDNRFDVVTSNGVLNLSAQKEKCFAEIYRVLKPGGRLQFADVVIKGEAPEGMLCTLESWSD